MDGLKQWALCLIIASGAGAFVMIVSPRGSMDKTIRAVTGIFVVASMCSPLMDIAYSFSHTSAPDIFASDYNSDGETVESCIIESFGEELKSMIISASSQLGLSPEEICTDMYIDEESCIIIQNITVTVNVGQLEEYNNPSQELSNILGFPVTVNAG